MDTLGVRGQFMKSPKVNLDEEIPELSFLAYTPHHVKVVDKHIFSIVNKSRAQRCGCSKAYALRIKKDWGYMIKNNREKQLKSWVRHVRLLLNTCLTVTTIVVHSGASRQEHQKKEIHTTTKTTNSAANKTQFSCKISSRRLFSGFKQKMF